jgi:hypothetical protein
MKVKQARLAQPIRGEISNIIESTKYELDFDKGMLTVKLKNNPKNLGDFIVFPANIAWLETEPEGKNDDDTKKQIAEVSAKIKEAQEIVSTPKVVVPPRRGKAAS